MFVPRSVVRRKEDKRKQPSDKDSREAISAYSDEACPKQPISNVSSPSVPHSPLEHSNTFHQYSSTSRSLVRDIPVSHSINSKDNLESSGNGNQETEIYSTKYNTESSGNGSREQEISSSSEEDTPVVSFRKNQRWPVSGEPVCIVCGRYGAYIVDQTDKDICSLECKAKHLHQLGLPLCVNSVHSLEVENKEKKEVETKELEVEAEIDDCEEEEMWCYKEHADIIKMTEDQAAAIRSKHALKVKGDTVVKPILQFDHLCLPSKVMLNLTDQGYNTPTPVQMQTIPAALSGRDLLVCAGTGSGKTLSFLLPAILNILQSTTPQQRASNPRVLVLSPTRELAIQIEQQAKSIVRGIPVLRTAVIVGGVPIAQQLHRLRGGVQVVIATPARLNDIIENHSSDIELMDIDVFVVDEVDCLLHMGFESQVHEIEKFLPSKRQNLMFSATIPRRIEKVAHTMMVNPLFICIGEPSVPCDSIKHTVIWVEEKAKRKKLIALLNDLRHFSPPAVVFVNSKMGTLLLADAVNKTCPHLAAVGIHGDMAQERRSEIVQGCLEGKYSIVVATNVLGRGVDLVNVKQVLVVDMSNSITEFIHQVGRAGRLGSPGTAYTFINNENRAVFMDLVNLLEPQGVQLPPQLLNSPHFKLQLDKRKRKNASKVFLDAGPGGSMLQGSDTVKKLKRDSDFYHDKNNLLALIRASSKTTSTSYTKK